MEAIIRKYIWLFNHSLYAEPLLLIIAIILLIKTLKLKQPFALLSEIRFYYFSMVLLFSYVFALYLFSDYPYFKKVIYTEGMNQWFSVSETYALYSILLLIPNLRKLKRFIIQLQYIIILLSTVAGILIITKSFIFPTYQQASIIYKFSAVFDAFKLLFILFFTFYYFIIQFRKNAGFITSEVAFIFSLFVYAAFGIVSYSITTHIDQYFLLRAFIAALPIFSLSVMSIMMYYFLKNPLFAENT